MDPRRVATTVAVLAFVLGSTGLCFAGYAEEYIGESVCTAIYEHCPDCDGWSVVDRTIKYSWSSAPVEDYTEEYDRYYIDRRCRSSKGVEETIHETHSVGQSVEKAHSWTAGLKEEIVIEDILSLSMSLSHTNSLTFTCNETHEHGHDWTLDYTKPSGKKGYFLHNYVLNGTDYSLLVVASCVSDHTGHLYMHTSGSSHGRPLGPAVVKARNRYLMRDVEPFVLTDNSCTACGSESMNCNGTSCTYVDPQECPCAHNE
jgi:hypothetical protein